MIFQRDRDTGPAPNRPPFFQLDVGLFLAFDFNQLFPVDGSHFDRPWYQQHGSCRVCLISGRASSLKGPFPRLWPSSRGLSFSPGAWGAPFFGGMPTGLEAFLEPPGASRLRSCARTYIKKGLVPHSSGWWGRKTNTIKLAASISYHDTIYR